MPARRRTAALLALFLGDFGVHQFYLHRWRRGLVYLAFCWTLVPAVLGIVDAISLLRQSDGEFASSFAPAVTTPMSPGGRYYWSGQAWVPAISPDGLWRWDGRAWVPAAEAGAAPEAPAGGPAQGALGSARFHRHAGYGAAIALAIIFVGALILGSVVDTVFDYRSYVGLNTLVQLALCGVLVGLTYFVAWVFNRFTHDPRRRHRHLVVAGIISAVVFALSLAVEPVLLIVNDPKAFATAVPLTAVGLWIWRRADSNEREPWRLVLVTVAWGGIIATTTAQVLERAFGVVIGQGAGVGTAFGAGFFEEGTKGVALLFLVWIYRAEFTGLIDGVVYGAAVGLGFNLVETMLYAGQYGFGQVLYRQTVGLFSSHPLWTAIIGLAIGLAWQSRSRTRRVALVLAGFAIAMFGHFVWDATLMTHQWLLAGVLLELGLLAGLMVVLRRARRAERLKVVAQLEAEAATSGGAVSSDELPDLARPRFGVRKQLALLRQAGFSELRRRRRLRRAQLELGVERLQRAANDGQPDAAEQMLRGRVLALKAAAAG